MDKKYILDKLSQIDKNKYGIFEIGLFGSYAKDNADGNSDIDILVKLELKKGMYQNFCELKKELEKIFNRKNEIYYNLNNISDLPKLVEENKYK